MLKFIRGRLQNKLILAFVLVLLIPTGIIAIYTNSIITNTVIEKARSDKLRAAELQAAAVEKLLVNIQNNLLFVSRTPGTKRYLAILAGAEDKKGAKDSLVKSLTALLKNSENYKEVEVFDANGKEVIAITRSGDTVTVSPDSDLEDASTEPAYNEAINLSPGQVYVSGLDLNTTQGKIDIPYVPIITYSTPLLASNGSIVGVLSLKANTDQILAAVKTDDPNEITYLMEAQGAYLVNPDSNKLYGRVLGTGISYFKEQVNDSGPIMAQLQEKGILFGSVDQPNMMSTFIRIHPTNQDAIQWVLLHQIPIRVILQDVSNAQQVILLLSLGALLLAIAVALFITRGIARPVRQLASVADAISRREWDTPIPTVGSGDEIGHLSSAFETMSKELKSLLTDLEARVAARTAELEVANVMAQESSRLKSEFMATMSHELRTPLNAMIGYSGILLEGMGGEMDEEARTMVDRIQENSRRLLKLINDVLDIAKIEAGRMEIMSVPFEPRQLAKGWRAQMAVLAEQKGIGFDIDIDPALPTHIYGDPERLSQISVNLLSNAFKFTEKGSVKLAMKKSDNTWIIEVTDTGIGIPPHALDYIFDEFRQVDGSSRRAYGGTGLGLAIVRNLCRMMSGNIVVTSVMGQGSTFTATLPLKPVVEAQFA